MKRVGLIAALATLVLTAWISRPLPRFVTRGIPASVHNIEQPAWRVSIPGDHLQLLYRFDLMRDMLSGRIRWFHNPYEFNSGDDHSTYRPSAYFFPMSALYALLAMMGGQALAWNLTLWVSVWLSAVFTWGWLRRFTDDSASIAVGTLVAVLLPFRWISLFGGSPSGMAMLWIPLIAWGVDVAVREARPLAGFWVGGGLLLCFWADLQTFYFAVLALPVFTAMSLAMLSVRPDGRTLRRWAGVAVAFGVMLVLMAAYHQWRKLALEESMMAGGRSLAEARLFSPSRRGLLQAMRGVSGTLFVGVFLAVALVLAAARGGMIAVRERRFGRLLVVTGVCALILLTLALGLGPNGPRGGIVFRGARALVPRYTMIRQPFKVLTLLPMWTAWLLAMGFASPVAGLRAGRRLRLSAVLVFGVAILVEQTRPLSTTVCLLEPEQLAYAAVARDAAARSESDDPVRLLAVPLWPGESADTTVPIYHGHHYRLPLVNGYSPVVRQTYFDTIFRGFQSINQGWLTSAQCDALLARGVRYVLLHENAFPERVSPFPVTLTRDRLMSHPRLAFLAQSGPVWAFRLNAATDTEAAGIPMRNPGVRFPTRAWRFETLAGGGVMGEDPRAIRGNFRCFSPGDSAASVGPWRVAPTPELAWLLRLRGHGVAVVQTRWDGQVIGAETVSLASEEWSWMRVPLPDFTEYAPVGVDFFVEEGQIDADAGMLIAGAWEPAMVPGESRTFDAVDFFHGGYSESDSHSVRLRPTHDPDTVVIYGPKLPLEPGRYALTWYFETTTTPADVEVGWVQVRSDSDDSTEWIPLRAASPVRQEWHQSGAGRVNAVLTYSRRAPLTVERIVLSRLSETGAAVDGLP